MSKISRIRIVNLGYNHDSIKIDDEIFDFGGQSTLISLRNGGGKSVLVQMIISQFVNRSFRDFGDRKFKSYFTTNRPTFIMTEWQLDNNVDRFLSGMMVRKNQKDDNDTEELEMYTFTGSYSEGCRYDMDNIPIVRHEGNVKKLKGFGECKSLFEDISKDKSGDFRLYDMGSRYGRNQYYSTLRQYQINNKEWESIIRKVNQKESGLSELFNNSRDEKNLVENWFLRPIEDKLNQDKNKIDEFRNLTLKFIEQYRSNQSRIERKGIIEQYFEDTKKLKEDIDKYVRMNMDKREQTARMVVYISKLNKTIEKLSAILDEKKKSSEEVENVINHIIYEQISYMIYEFKDEKEAAVLDRVEQEIEITRLTQVIDKLSRQLDVYDCNKIFSELKEIKAEKAGVDEKINILLQNSENNKDEIEKIGYKLYIYYTNEINKNIKLCDENTCELKNIGKLQNEMLNKRSEGEAALRNISTSIGKLENAVSAYDEVEDIFNKDFSCDLKRNILGLYEDGILDVKKKEMEEETQEENNNLARLSKKKSELELKSKMLLQEERRNNEAISDIRHKISVAADKLTDFEKQKEYRLKVIKYVGLKESDIDNVNLIIDSLDRKIQELDIAKSGFIARQSVLKKKYTQLKEGKTVELTDNIKNYCEQNDISFVYGMEWLNKNGRTIEKNTELVSNNPFIPYSVIMERNAFERFKNVDEGLYTSFPIPVIIKDELEKAVDNVNNHITTYGNIHFFIMFNNHLLDKEELEKMLLDIQHNIEQLEKLIQDKTSDIAVFNEYEVNIVNQTFSTSLYEKTDEDIRNYKNDDTKLRQRQQQIRNEKDSIDEEYKDNNKLIESSRDTIKRYGNRAHEYDRLCKKYIVYQNDSASLSREKNELQEREKNQKLTIIKLAQLSDTLISLNAKKNKLEEMADKLNQKKEEYIIYSDIGLNEVNKTDSKGCEEIVADIIPEQLEARLNALTKEVSDTIEELTNRQKKLTGKILNKEKDLKKKNRRNISEDEYKDVVFSDEHYDELERQKERTSVELNDANQKNDSLAARIAELEKDIQYGLKDLKEKTGFDEPIIREFITDTDFTKRINLKRYESNAIKREIVRLDGRKNELSAKLSGVAEYADSKPEVSQEKLVEIMADIPDLESVDKAELEQYHREMKKELISVKDALSRYQNYMAEQIRNIADKKYYEEDYFRKTFASLLTQTGNPDALLQQYNTNKSSYESQLEKLKIDLASIDNEQKNIEEMFLEYIKNVNNNVSMIDKNSTISVRGKNIKMLRINVPDWESEKEHYRIQLHEYFERIIKLGLDTIEANKNLSELLGSIISTKNLYDDVVGINNIKIKLYKIEAEREVPISWADVSANSGGEGFLSAFVILTCLLSYMRRDENDLFTTGEEGKVLIMDNPFAQTYSAHLLKPLMEMAKKTNTQLICLSGLGGDSIYNRFDNIYVLKLIDSNIRNGVQRVEGEHIKGNEVKRMVLSEFRTEQISMFDMIEERE